MTASVRKDRNENKSRQGHNEKDRKGQRAQGTQGDGKDNKGDDNAQCKQGPRPGNMGHHKDKQSRQRGREKKEARKDLDKKKEGTAKGKHTKIKTHRQMPLICAART